MWLRDIERLRNDAASMDAPGVEVISSPMAAGAFTQRLGEVDVIELIDCRNAWGRGVSGPGRAGTGGHVDVA